jgi:hypothetical protein
MLFDLIFPCYLHYRMTRMLGVSKRDDYLCLFFSGLSKFPAVDILGHLNTGERDREWWTQIWSKLTLVGFSCDICVSVMVSPTPGHNNPPPSSPKPLPLVRSYLPLPHRIYISPPRTSILSSGKGGGGCSFFELCWCVFACAGGSPLPTYYPLSRTYYLLSRTY